MTEPAFRRFDLEYFGAPTEPSLDTLRRPALTLGVFDGVHRGHAVLLERLVAAARARQVDAVVITYWPHPRAVVGGAAPAAISTLEHRVALLRRQGVSGVVVLAFDQETAALSPEDFLAGLCSSLRPSAVVVGADHRFGRDRQGDVDLLRRQGRRLGFEVEAVELVELDAGGERVSSTAVREAIRAGDLERAERLLGRPLAVLGRVVPGDQRGRQLGFPTANLDLGQALRPPGGVYAVMARTVEEHVDGPLLPAVANVGRRPTFGPADTDLVEVHLLRGGQDLYGKHLEVEFLARLRDEQRFDGVEALRAQLERDCAAARSTLRRLRAL